MHIGNTPTGTTMSSAAVNRARIKKSELHIEMGKALLAHMRHKGEELMVTRDGTWFYEDGNWELRVDKLWLKVRIAAVFAGFGYNTTNKLIWETLGWIERRPELYRHHQIPWDQHGKIPVRNGLVDPMTGELEPHRPDHFATWRIDVDYDPAARCPWWETMLADMFEDKPEVERGALIRVIQECFGAALIDKKPRSLSKGLVFWGVENRGKSGPLEVAAGLFGKTISAPIGSLEGAHGLMPFQQRAPWVLHEAFSGQWHFSSYVKSIITQDPVMINIKNGPMISKVIHAPIFWATNFQPQFKEATRAIVSRLIIIEVNRAFVDGKPIGAAAEAIKRGYSKPGEFVVATELQGVLNWAIAGLKRAKQRGHIDLPASVKETAEAIHRDSNLVVGFLDECVEFDPLARLKIADFCLAHTTWWLQMKGESRKLPSNEAINKALQALGERRIAINRDELRDSSGRYYCGMKLNKAGLDYHKTGSQSALFERKALTATVPGREVNSDVPVSWDSKSSIAAMRKAFDAMTRSHAADAPTGHSAQTGHDQ